MTSWEDLFSRVEGTRTQITADGELKIRLDTRGTPSCPTEPVEVVTTKYEISGSIGDSHWSRLTFDLLFRGATSHSSLSQKSRDQCLRRPGRESGRAHPRTPGFRRFLRTPVLATEEEVKGET